MNVKGTILAAALALLVSCGKEAVEINGGENAGIGFVAQFAHNGKSTRGSAITDAAGIAAAGGFSVWAYSYSGDWATASGKETVINNTGEGYGHVWWDVHGAEWNYGTWSVWPKDRKISFFAYAPHGSARPEGVNMQGIPEIFYEVPALPADQKDLLIADELLDRVGPDPVRELFHHALSRISFSGLKSGSMRNKDVVINSIELKNIYYKGSAALQVPVLWRQTPDTRDYVLSVADGSLLNLSLYDTNAQNLLPASGGSLFLMPQRLNAAAMMVINFTVDGRELLWQGAFPLSPETWQPGKSYHYKISISGELVTILCAELEPTSEGGEWGRF